jgi:hypothetical protein
MYTRINWQNGKNGNTPVNNVNLNKMDVALFEHENKLNLGWINMPAILTHVGVDGPMATVNTSVDLRNTNAKGQKIKYEQIQALTGVWNLDANSSSQLGSFNGTDTAITYSAGKFGNGAIFNGTTSKIVLTDNTLLKPTGAFTIGMWFKTNATGARKFLFQSYSINTNIAGFVCEIRADGKLNFLIGNNTGAGIVSEISGTTTVTDNNWHYVVFTYNNNYAQIYLDGKLEGSGYSLNPVYGATNYIRIGCANYSGSDLYFMNGQMDDIYFINGYVLDEQTIKAKYDNQTAQEITDLTLHKQGIIHDITSTTMLIYCGTDFILTNNPITNVYYSMVKCPYGFQMNPDKWTILLTSDTEVYQNNPVIGTYYNFYIFTGHIGSWKFVIAGNLAVVSKVNVSLVRGNVTLSTANNTKGDNGLTCFVGLNGYQNATYNIATLSQFYREKPLNLTVKTPLFLNVSVVTGDCSSINLVGNQSRTEIKAVSAYL